MSKKRHADWHLKRGNEILFEDSDDLERYMINEDED